MTVLLAPQIHPSGRELALPGQHSLTVLSFTINQNTISCIGDSSDTVATTFCSEHTSTDVVVSPNQNLHGDLVAWV